MRLTEQAHADLVRKAAQAAIDRKKCLPTPRASSGVKRWQALGRLPQGELNNTEKAFAAYLQERQAAGAIMWWKAHPFNVTLAKNTHYRPDFLVMNSAMELIIYEVKGSFTSEKGQMKIKLCVEALPVFKVIKASKIKGGGWKFEEF